MVNERKIAESLADGNYSPKFGISEAWKRLIRLERGFAAYSISKGLRMGLRRGFSRALSRQLFRWDRPGGPKSNCRFPFDCSQGRFSTPLRHPMAKNPFMGAPVRFAQDDSA